MAAIARNASGTWKVWEDLWFYMTSTLGFTDIKMHLKVPFKAPDQMRYFEMSKALSPHHYRETVENPVRTKALLHAWTIYRARKNGWAAAKAYRVRHLARMIASLKAGVRAADTRERPRIPLLENAAAHKWLEKWVPDVVQEMLQEP